MNLTLKNVRISYPALFTPRKYKADKDKDPKYSVECILHPKRNADDIEALEDAIEDLINEAFSGKRPKNMRVLIKDGNDKVDDEDEIKNGYENMKYIKVSSKKKIPVVDRDLTPLEEKDDRPYGGSFCNVSIRLYAQDNEYGKHINVQLRGVQFVKDGERFGGDSTLDPDKEFENLDEDDQPKRKKKKSADDDIL